ncbi:hypothetical protein [Acidihalobacter yilgarnensis]|nr:hypothetical protein [Acidihalobacter yilgarnensis]
MALKKYGYFVGVAVVERYFDIWLILGATLGGAWLALDQGTLKKVVASIY